ncbi:hypothetical protein F53441_4285 [Fusarium austroafricanum]|uniref:Uncharacterized protein n=1 Tax=Fusarium austroafricanum TaxID=2364996 RepID=A0A8H4KP98_9HYPO|nr:hypothetical protein F53441_4285 [Fusarium austroafricanum]
MTEPPKPSSSKESPGNPEKKADSGENIATIENLPIDVLSYALSFLPDKAAIRAILLSGPALYNAFKLREAYIASCVLFNTMDEPVVQEAIVTFNMKMAEWKGANAGIKAINRVYSSEQRRIYSQLLTFDRVKEMWRLQESIKYFAQRIPQSIIRKHPVLRFRDAFSLTPTVRIRFQRALYRLDAYMKIMEVMAKSYLYDNGGKNRDLNDEELEEAHWMHCLRDMEEHRIIKAFQSQYSVVELEQMSSICGLLITEIAPTFNAFLERDIELGTQLPYYITDPLTSGAMSLVAQGLPFLQDFVSAPSRIQRSKIMRKIKPPIDWNPRLPSRPPFPANDEKLTCVLHDCEPAPTPGRWAKMETPGFIMRTPFLKDPDQGPENAWAVLGRYAVFLNDSNGEPATPYYPLHWGYVFWDLEMLKKAEFHNIDSKSRFEYGFAVANDHPVHMNYAPLSRWDNAVAADLLLASRQEKLVLKARGKSGYFDFDGWAAEAEAAMFREFREQMEAAPPDVVAATFAPMLSMEGIQRWLNNFEAQNPELMRMALESLNLNGENGWAASLGPQPAVPESENRDETT